MTDIIRGFSSGTRSVTSLKKDGRTLQMYWYSLASKADGMDDI